MSKYQKGQSTLEYVILVTAVIVVMIMLLGDGGVFRGTLQNTAEDAVEKIGTVGARWNP